MPARSSARSARGEPDRFFDLGQLVLEDRSKLYRQRERVPVAVPEGGAQYAVDAVLVLVEVAHRELVGAQLDDQQAEGQSDGQPEEVDRRVAAFPPQVAEGRGQVVPQHACPFVAGSAVYSVRSVSTGLVMEARIAWWPTVRPATRKERAPEVRNRPAPTSTW